MSARCAMCNRRKANETVRVRERGDLTEAFGFIGVCSNCLAVLKRREWARFELAPEAVAGPVQPPAAS